MKQASQQVFLSLGLSLILLIGGCTTLSAPPATELPPENASVSQSTTVATESAPVQPVNNEHMTLADVEHLAGFDVLEPAYLPKGVSFDFATFQNSPSPLATLHFKIIHEVYGDMGSFFQIAQEPQNVPPPDTTSCGENKDGCEILSVGDKQIVYRLNAGGTEGLSWYAEGIAFRLLRTAGEPNKVYKDELVHVVESMKK